ncbi:iron(III) transport system ATP-binding protein [Caloramator quimbayensis]|uniref:Iron(III) transport system ATP-binding protein n=1 Tax=Caloramator quimbayensis TaxID=1147123 RepID=A0A1T4Y5X1_9CLOT|nr:ABC transporter ATP-binding protein [Caloramator quimbayensis]SKA97234.1 iron(III) transport system ATP-binding protein [Caloramator quimbayensis]
MSVSISIQNVVKKYDKTVIIPDLSLNIKNGEFFTLLGPSGCGKTTLLRMIAGFNSIEGGEIKFDDAVINDIPAHKRNIGMVFQNYAIFPHMTVKENVEYGLKLRKVPKDEMNKKVEDILKVVKIDTYKDRLPERLSGGQQQRVALARAIVIHPSVLLMDEPLSNLDAKLRIEMRSAIRDIQKEVGITTVYVTHDQEEALAISDRIAVMKDGVIQQVGSPKQIYTRPSNVFVSTFIGSSNLLNAKIKIESGKKYVCFDDFSVEMTNLSEDIKDNQKVIVSVRPEEFSLSDKGIKFKIKNSTFFGRYINYEILPNKDLIAGNQPYFEFTQDLGHVHDFFEADDELCLSPNPLKINVFTEDGEKSLIRDVKENE